MGQVATKEERERMQDMIGQMHVSTAEGMAVNYAITDKGPCVILVVDSCCGVMAFEIPIPAAKELKAGFDGALNHHEASQGKMH